MKLLFLILSLGYVQAHAAIDIGFGNSSFTSGRAVPSLALGFTTDSWSLLYRSVGVQTTIYSQNSWTIGAFKNAYHDSSGVLNSSIGAGIGGSYSLRAFRPSLTDEINSKKEFVVGPHLILRLQAGLMFVAFDTLLGLTKQIEQHLTLNFQDVSHVSIGVTF